LGLRGSNVDLDGTINNGVAVVNTGEIALNTVIAV
jgi:hypothetical protein